MNTITGGSGNDSIASVSVKPSLHVVTDSLADDLPSVPVHLASVRQISATPRTMPMLALELNNLFQNLNDPKFNEIRELLPEEPISSQDLHLLEGTKFYSQEKTVTTPAATQGADAYVDSVKSKMTVVLPSRFLDSPIQGLAALDWVAASINHLTKEWKEKPFSIDVKIEGDKRNPILTEAALDRMAAKREKYPTGWTYTLFRPNGANGYKAGLLLATATEDDYGKVQSNVKTDGLRRVLDKTGLQQNGKYATHLGELGMMMSPVMLSSGVFLLSPMEGESFIVGTARRDRLEALNYVGSPEATFEQYRHLHQENGGLLTHKAHFNRDFVRAQRDNGVFPINPLNPLARTLLQMFDASASLTSHNIPRINMHNDRVLEVPVLGALAEALGLEHFIRYNEQLRQVRQVDNPQSTDPYIMPDKVTDDFKLHSRRSI